MGRKLLLHPSLSQALGAFTNISQLKQVHAYVIVSGFAHDDFTSCSILACAAISPVADVTYEEVLITLCILLLFEEFPSVVDVVPWNSLLTGYSASGEMDALRQIFYEMPCKNTVWNAMISGYVQSGRIDEAMGLLSEMHEKGVALWSALVFGYSQNGICTEALNFFTKMVAAAVVPNDPALVTAVSACAQLRALEEGKLLHDYIERENSHIYVTLGTALIDMYASLAFSGYGKQALSLFRRMRLIGPTPNAITFMKVLSGCSNSGLVDKGYWVFNLMTELAGLVEVLKRLWNLWRQCQLNLTLGFWVPLFVPVDSWERQARIWDEDKSGQRWLSPKKVELEDHFDCDMRIC
ncbi:Pentatricopeptide repeat [Dillenia turbinata]|uniref:Pentatricopeptide repeat n=1 Tax=Dillenia turbinata TaxID=194707 RepID=A0AAN8UMG9_9MAGN